MLPRIQTSETSLQFDLVIPSMVVANHKQVMPAVAAEISKMIGIHERILKDRLAETEKEKPSAMGDGVSITHLQVSGLKQSMNIFIRLKHAVMMHTPDNKDVDILCVLLTPEREGSSYLRTLARISRLLRNPQTCARLRAAADEKTLRAILESSSTNAIAA